MKRETRNDILLSVLIFFLALVAIAELHPMTEVLVFVVVFVMILAGLAVLTEALRRDP